MTTRTRSFRRHAGSMHEREGEPGRERAIPQQRFMEERAKYEEEKQPAGLKKIPEHFKPRTEPRESHRQPHKESLISPKLKRQIKEVGIGIGKSAIETGKKFFSEAAKGGAEITKEIEQRQRRSSGGRRGSIEEAVGAAIGVKTSPDGKQRINEHGYIEVLGKEGKWIFTGVKAKFKIKKTGFDEATGLEYEAESDEIGEMGGDADSRIFSGGGGFIGGESRRKPRMSKEERYARHHPELGMVGAPEPARPFAPARAAPAWQSGISGENLPTREEYEPIIGSGLGVMHTGLFPMAYGQQTRQIVTSTPSTPRPVPPQVPPQRASRRAAPAPAPVYAPPPAQPAGMIYQEQPEPQMGSGLSAMSSGIFPMSYGAKPQARPQPMVVLRQVPVPQTGKKKGKKGVQEEVIEEIIIPPEEAPAEQPTNSSSFSAFNEVFGDRGLRL